MLPVTFTVYGEPKPQGSTRVVPIRAKGGGYLHRDDGRPVLRPIHDNGEKLRSWRAEIVAAFHAVYAGDPIDGPVSLTVEFYRPRPKSHYNAKGMKKHSAPIFPTTRPDTLKLVRAVEDALTGHAWKDDSQIVEHLLSKWYGACYATVVTIAVMEME